MSANVSKQQRFFLLPKTPLTNIAKITGITNVPRFKAQIEKEEAKKGPEMSANFAKIAKVTRNFVAS